MGPLRITWIQDGSGRLWEPLGPLGAPLGTRGPGELNREAGRALEVPNMAQYSHLELSEALWELSDGHLGALRVLSEVPIWPYMPPSTWGLGPLPDP